MKTNSFVSLKKTSVKAGLLVLAASSFGANHASAAMFKLLGAANMTSKSLEGMSAGSTFTGNFAFTAPGSAVVLGSGTAALELGVNYLTRKFTIKPPGVPDITAKYSMVNIPVMLRLNLGRVVSLGLGGYANLPMGNLTEEGAVSITQSVKDRYKTTEFGAVASLGFDIPMGASTGLVIDGRYTMALAEALNDANVANGFSWKPSDIQAFVGLRFGASK